MKMTTSFSGVKAVARAAASGATARAPSNASPMSPARAPPRQQQQPRAAPAATSTSSLNDLGSAPRPNLPLYQSLAVLAAETGFMEEARAWFGEAPSAWQRPFHSAGAMGVAILSFLLTYRWPWEEVGWNHSHRMIHDSAAWIDYAMAGLLTIASLAFLAKSLRRREVLAGLMGAAPVVAVAGYVLAAGMGASPISMILYNLYVFVLGVATAVSGVRRGRMGTVNAGMLVLAVLIIARFFDSDLPFLVRGLAFIAVGAGFLATNVVLLARKRKGVAP